MLKLWPNLLPSSKVIVLVELALHSPQSFCVYIEQVKLEAVGGRWKMIWEDKLDG